MNQRYIDLAVEQINQEVGCGLTKSNWISYWAAQPDEKCVETYQRLVKIAVAYRARCLQVDDVLTTNWITVKDNDYKQALHDLIGFNIQIENDPAVSESAASRKNQLDSLKEENKKLRAALSKLTKEQK